jgi:hypothetical protein
VDREQWSEARVHLAAVEQLPAVDPLDATHKQRARELLPRVDARLAK